VKITANQLNQKQEDLLARIPAEMKITLQQANQTLDKYRDLQAEQVFYCVMGGD